MTDTATITPTPTLTPTATDTPVPGGEITFFGLTRSDDNVVEPVAVSPDGLPIYERRVGFLFSLVIEGKPLAPPLRLGDSSFRHDPGDPSVRPDLEVIVSRPLGDGSLEVCDNMLPMIGGIPSSPDFGNTQEVANAINDLGCRFVNGEGQPVGRLGKDACTVFPDGRFRFVEETSQIQFCGLIAQRFAFPVGDTRVSARLRDRRGGAGPSASIIVRVLP